MWISAFLLAEKEGYLASEPDSTIVSYIVRHSHTRNKRIAATPYCSLYLPQAAVANVPHAPPVLGFESLPISSNKKATTH